MTNTKNTKETTLRKPLFGKEIVMALQGMPDNIAQDILLEAYDYALKLQKIFNFYDSESELSILNKKREMQVSNDLLFVIKRALELGKETKGSYDISLGLQFKQRKLKQEIKPLNCSYKDIKISKNTVTLKHPDILIDLGSIAKGYIADKIGDFLKQRGVKSGIIDARGDLVVFGDEKTIEVQHPRDKAKAIVKLKVKNTGVATSGDYNQFSGSFSSSHILNQKEIISVTVIAKTLVEADAFATVLFVSNEKEREKIIQKNPKIKVLTIDKNLNRKEYNGFSTLTLGEKDE